MLEALTNQLQLLTQATVAAAILFTLLIVTASALNNQRKK